MREESREDYRDLEMPSEVAAWHAEQRWRNEEALERFGPWLSWQFAGVETLEPLEALSAEELFARPLEANDPRTQLERHLRGAGKEVPPEAGEAVAGMLPRRTVIGSAVEDDSTVHVVYRTRLEGGPDLESEGVAMVTVRRSPQGWRLWTGSRDRALFSESHTGIAFFTVEDERERLRELAQSVVTRTLDDGGAARAFLVGHTGGTEPAKSFVIDVARPDGTKVRVDVPSEAFARVAELILGWPESGTRTPPR